MDGVTSVGIIMDGNRRFAKERGLPTLEGHRQGYNKLKDVMNWCREAEIPNLVVFGFSTENWNRSKDEVSYLMDLIRDLIVKDAKEMKKQGGRLRIVGQKDRFSEDIQEAMREAEEITKEGTTTLWLALSYGGRAEILNATNELLKEGKVNVTEEEFNQKLWTAGMPDPDIILRSSGEQRLSGFLPWQGIYSELFFTKTHWPAFTKEEFFGILDEYSTRQRRMGK
jgi:undecaprenyl diphosphate synthase